MSAPVIPSKPSYKELHDNSEVKNDNERLFSTDDSNANQIISTGQSPEEEEKRGDEAGEKGVAHRSGTENLIVSGREKRKCLGWIQESHVGVMMVKEPRRYSPITRKYNEEFLTDDAKDNMKHFTVSQGQTERTPIPLEFCTSEITLRDKCPPFNTFEIEGIPQFSYGGSNQSSIRPKTPSIEVIGNSSDMELHSASPDSPDTSCHTTGAALKSPKTPADNFLNQTFHPLDNASEDKKTVFYTTASTSEIRKNHVPEIQMDTGKLQNINKPSTLNPMYADHRLAPTGKTQEICNLAEAQLGQTEKARRLGLPQPKSNWQSRAESIMLVEMVTCHRDSRVKGKHTGGTDVADSSQPQILDIFSDTGELGLKQSDALANSKPSTPLLAPGTKDNGNWPVLDQTTDEYVTAEKEHRPAFPFPVEPTNIQATGMLLPSRYKFFDDNGSGYFAAGKDPNLFVHNVNPPGTAAFRDPENTVIQGKGNADAASVKASEFSDYQRFWSKDTAATECPKYRERDSDSPIPASSSKVHSEDRTPAMQIRKPAIRERHPSDEAKESHKALLSPDTILPVPIPLCPVTRGIINKQTSTSSLSLRNLYALHVDRLSPSTVLPPSESTQLLNIPPQSTSMAACNTATPKPVLVHSTLSVTSTSDGELNQREVHEEKSDVQLVIPKPKQVRPKIITCIRRSPQTVERPDTSFESTFSSIGSPTCTATSLTDQRAFGTHLKSPNVLYDNLKPDVQKSRGYSSGLMVSGIKPPGHQFGQMSEKYLPEVPERPGKDEFCSPPCSHYEVPSGYYRSAMILKPQLGLGAVSRLPSAKSRILIASQRSSNSALHQQGQVASADSLYHPDASVDLKKSTVQHIGKGNLPKPCHSGLRPPGYSRLPTAKLTTFGFVRSSSVSSVSSNQSNDSIHSDSTKPPNRSALANEEQSTSKAASSTKDIPRGQQKMVQQVSTSMSNLRRSFLPAPRTNTPTEKSVSPSPGSPHRSSPVSGSKKIQKDLDSKPVSPKRTSATSNFSPGHSKTRTSVGRNGFNTRPEADRQLVQRLKEKCEEQSRQLLYVQEELKRASLGFEVFAVTTQHFFNKNERGQKKEKELYLELANIRDEVAVNTEKCEKLQKEKEELERNFEDEVKKLQNQQVAELHTLEERLLLQYQTEMARLQSDHTSEIARIKTRHQKQVEDMTVTHEATVQGLETHHTEAIAVMQDEHMYQVEEMKCNHELEKKTLEDNFENLRLSLQDQVDTLTFQSHSLRDRAKRFEEALRKSSDEQFQAAFAPFQHLEEDLSSLKQVLEMKNQQIHEQEKRIMELEKLVDINVRLEERIQVLQQQNEDLKVRIDKNVAVTRHLSEENANLHESVEKESEEKKRLSRTNEELIWKLQTGEPMSPVRLSPSSALYHSVSGSLSPSKVHAAPR